MKVVYLHGFASSGNSTKARALMEEFGLDNVISPDLPVNPLAAMDVIAGIIHANANDGIVLVGTSLGGFYAHYFAQRFDIPCVLVNPSTQPSVTMLPRVGSIFKNYSTGEEFQVTEDHVQSFTMMEDELNYMDKNGGLVNLFVALDDDVLDPNVTLEYFEHCRTKVRTSEGGHRFDSMWYNVIPVIRGYM